MRVFRTILGMLMLTVGLPTLLAGAAFWAAMQHRDAGGAFTGDLQRVATSGYAVVVDDVDGLLGQDAPFVRLGDTRLRITAQSSGSPAFVGIAPAADVTRFLADVPHVAVTSIDLGTGALPVTGKLRPGTIAPEKLPGGQSFWLKSGTGTLDWNPTDLRNTAYSLVIMNPAGQPGVRLESTAALRPGWLNQATWGLLILGSLLVMLGMIVLGWPSRRREVVYVVEPSQVPDLMQAIGAPLPLSRTGGGRHAGTHRPRTLADTQQRSRPPALTWPPSSSTPPAPSSSEPSSRGPAIPMPAAPVSGAATSASPELATAAARVPSAAPGEPLSLVTTRPTPGSAADPAPLADPLFAKGADRQRRRPQQPPDLPIFEASAVGAWVAETAPTRARDTEARAAAAIRASRKATDAPASDPVAPTIESTPVGYDVVVVGMTAQEKSPQPAGTDEPTKAESTKADEPNTIGAVAARLKPAAAGVAAADEATARSSGSAADGASSAAATSAAPAASATPASATPASATPASATPASATPASATPASATPADSATPASATSASAAGGAPGKAAGGKAAAPGPVVAAPAASEAPKAASSSEESDSAPVAGAAAKAARPAAATPRNALFGGSSAPGWAATGLTRADSSRVGPGKNTPKDDPSAAGSDDKATSDKAKPPVQPAERPATPSATPAKAETASKSPAGATSAATSQKTTATRSTPARIQPATPVAASSEPSVPAASGASAPAQSTGSGRVPTPSAGGDDPADGEQKAATAPAQPAPTNPLPVPPTTPPPAPARPAVPGPSRPADPDREPVPTGLGGGANRPSVATVQTGATPASDQAETSRPPSWPAAAPAASNTHAEATRSLSKPDLHITEQRHSGSRPAEALPEAGPTAATRTDTAKPSAASTPTGVSTGTPTAASTPAVAGMQAAVSTPAVAGTRATVSAPSAATKPAAAPASAEEAGETDASLTGDESAEDAAKGGKRKPEGMSRLANYRAEVAELLGGDSAARRRRKNTTASGLPAPDPATQEPPIKLTRPARKGADPKA